jgi:hypothetical protein
VKAEEEEFRGKNRFSHDLFVQSLQGNLRKYCGVFYAAAFTPNQPWQSKG